MHALALHCTAACCLYCSQSENQKSELKRRARAYGSFCSQVIVVYLYPFRRNSLFRSQKIAKNINIFRVQGHSRSSMLTLLRSSLSVLVMISSMSVPICNYFHVKGVNSGKITPFQGGAPILPPRSWGPLYPGA